MLRIAALRSLVAPLCGDMTAAAGSRSLYSAASLGLDNYLGTRERVQNYLVDNGEKFRSKMNEFVEDASSRNMIFTEDLKNMVHIVEKDQTDIELTVKMIKKFNAQNKEVRFGNFIFGPIVMRMFHYLGDEQRALECFQNPELTGFFDQLISYQILVDMLYEKQRYQDVRAVFDAIRSRQIQGGMYPKHVVVLVFAACYKENTPESFAYSTQLWKELNDVGHIPMRKATTFAAALALAQGAPHVALEIVGTVRQQSYMTVRNIKVLALAQLGRCDDVIPVLRSVLEHQQPQSLQPGDGQPKKQTLSATVVEGVRAEVAKSADRELQQNYAKLERLLVDSAHVTEQTLDQLLCTEIVSTAHSAQRKDRSVLAASYANNDGRRRSYGDQPQGSRYGGERNGGGGGDRQQYNRRPNNRPGLNDLY